MEIIKVASNSDVNKVAGAIAAVVRKSDKVKIISIGASAVNQTVKSIIVARGYVIYDGFDLVVTPSFTQLEVNGELKTAIAFIVKVVF